jgi:multidrug efflux pump subunit AcrA (membrane-fusion protein)
VPKARLTLRQPRVLLVIALIVLLGAGTTVWAISRPSAATNTSTTTVAASASTVRQTVTASGTIEPASEADLSFQAGGTVTAVRVKVGAKVAKGAVLATVDATDLAAAVDSAQASVTAADAQLAATSTSNATALAAARAQVAAADSRLAIAKQSLSEATLTSPIAGTVASVAIASGDRVTGSGTSGSGGTSGGSGSGGATATGTTQSGSTVSGLTAAGTTSSSTSSSSAQIVVISTSSWMVTASVGSADLAQVRRGLQAEITPTDGTTRAFGVVDSVGIVASSSSGSATFPVTITVTGTPTGLYAGGTADVVIVVKQLPDVLTVPTAAIHTVNGETVVYQRNRGKAVTTPVTVGTVYGSRTQILRGIKAGDTVVVTSFRPGGVGGAGTRRQNGAGIPGAGFSGGGRGTTGGEVNGPPAGFGGNGG